MDDCDDHHTLEHASAMSRTFESLGPTILALTAAIAILGGASMYATAGPVWGGIFMAEWLLMTGAMMLPSSLPFLAAVHQVGGSAAGCAAALAYVVVWSLLGAMLGSVLWLAGDVLSRQPPGDVVRFAGACLIAAAIYQLTPLASSCQRACAHPFAILARHWHGVGAHARNGWNAGLHYGLSCIGCCVAMIVAMVVVGVHDLIWMLLLGGLMVLQKHTTWGPHYAMLAAVAMAAAGSAMAGGWWMPALRNLRAVCGA